LRFGPDLYPAGVECSGDGDWVDEVVGEDGEAAVFGVGIGAGYADGVAFACEGYRPKRGVYVRVFGC